MMKRILVITLLALLSIQLLAQTDTDVEVIKPKASKNFGLGFGISYSMLDMQSSPFVLVDSIGKMGESRIQNTLGLNISAFYNIHISEKFMLRPGVDANIMRAHILYDTRLNNKKRSDIFPVTAEIPITAIWKFPCGDIRNDGFQPSINAIIGIRPVVAIKQFKSAYPTTKDFNLNVDAGVGFPIKTKKLNFTIEAIFSYGLLNLIGENDEDFYTTSVSQLGRSYAGLRFYFN